MLNYEDISPSQREAIYKWWQARDPSDLDRYAYLDNTRYATAGNKSQEEKYREIESAGCCGFVDVVLDCSDGTKLMYGFNYGH